MYALISGCLPFYGNTHIEVFDMIKKAQVNFEYREFQFVSQSAKELISLLLTKDKATRYTCADAL
jgi:serine/threonine protein kinase